jgi:zinc transport system substrate-binding protein
MKHLIGTLIIIAFIFTGWYTLTKNNSSGIATQSPSTSATDIQVVTSIYPLAYIAERIIGKADVVVNISEGSDPHDYRLSAQDIQKMVDADIVILQGADLEPWGEDIKTQLERESVSVMIASEYVTLHEMVTDDRTDHDVDADEHDKHDEHEEGHDEHGDEHSDEHKEEAVHEENDDHDKHGHGKYDPHAWLQPALMSEIAATMTEKFSIIKPLEKEVYKNNLIALQKDLKAIDIEYTDQLSQCSLDEVITSHDAFGYIARSYGFEIHTISGLSTQDTPSVVTLAKLKKEAAEGISTILLEENSIRDYGETLARETGLKTASINPIVSSIPMGKDYLDLMRSNLLTFKTALNCNE